MDLSALTNTCCEDHKYAVGTVYDDFSSETFSFKF